MIAELEPKIAEGLTYGVKNIGRIIRIKRGSQPDLITIITGVMIAPFERVSNDVARFFELYNENRIKLDSREASYKAFIDLSKTIGEKINELQINLCYETEALTKDNYFSLLNWFPNVIVSRKDFQFVKKRIALEETEVELKQDFPNTYTLKPGFLNTNCIVKFDVIGEVKQNFSIDIKAEMNEIDENELITYSRKAHLLTEGSIIGLTFNELPDIGNKLFVKNISFTSKDGDVKFNVSVFEFVSDAE